MHVCQWNGHRLPKYCIKLFVVVEKSIFQKFLNLRRRITIYWRNLLTLREKNSSSVIEGSTVVSHTIIFCQKTLSHSAKDCVEVLYGALITAVETQKFKVFSVLLGTNGMFEESVAGFWYPKTSKHQPKGCSTGIKLENARGIASQIWCVTFAKFSSKCKNWYCKRFHQFSNSLAYLFHHFVSWPKGDLMLLIGLPQKKSALCFSSVWKLFQQCWMIVICFALLSLKGIDWQLVRVHFGYRTPLNLGSLTFYLYAGEWRLITWS